MSGDQDDLVIAAQEAFQEIGDAVRASIENCCPLDEGRPCPSCRLLAADYVAAARALDNAKGIN